MVKDNNKGELLKEQVKLLKMQTEIKQILSKVNEHLNILKVEELQLKSNSIRKDIKVKAPVFNTEATAAHQGYQERPEDVNKQDLDLEMMINKFDQEDEDSDGELF